MKTFAYLIHPTSQEQLKDFFKTPNIIPAFFAKIILRNIAPFKVFRIHDVRSIQDRGVSGYFIALPMVLSQEENDNIFIMDKILAAIGIAEKLGVNLLGLGGCASLYSDKGFTAIRTAKIPITSGSVFNAWTVYEAIFRIAKAKGLDLKKSKLAIIGAASAIGSLSARKFSECVGRLVINTNSDARIKLEALREQIMHLGQAEVEIETDFTLAVHNADIVIFTDDIPRVSLDIRDLKPQAIACDASIGKTIFNRRTERGDVTFINAGLIKMPFQAKFYVNTGLPEKIIPAALAETILLSLEEKFVSYSQGANVNLDKMEEIADIAARHGFEVWVPEAPLL